MIAVKIKFHQEIIQETIMTTAPPSRIRLMMTGAIGNIIEYYDFALFGYLATIIGANFFPSDNPSVSIVAAFGAFAVGAIMRPVGAVIFGHIGDAMSRKAVLLLSILMMAIPTALLSILPTFAQAGVYAPVLLVVLRMVQGLSVGGEFSGSIVYVNESAAPKNKGLMTAVSTAGGLVGILLGGFVCYLTTSILGDAVMQSWGWRIPFALSVIISVTGVFLRRGLSDSYHPPVEETEFPVLRLWRLHRGMLFAAFGGILAGTVFFYTLAVYTVTWLSEQAGLSTEASLEINTTSMLAAVFLFIGAGMLADRWGAIRVMRAGLILSILAALPIYFGMSSGNHWFDLGSEIVLFAILGLIIIPTYIALVDIFPASVRSTGLALSVNIAEGVVGGSMPAILQFTVMQTGWILVPPLAILIGSALTLLVISTTATWRRLAAA